MTLMNRIEKLFGHLSQPSEQQLHEALRALSVTRGEIQPYISEATLLPYGRNVLYHTNELEIVVIHLPPHTSSAIHDHGCSFGCEIVVEGELVNCCYRLDGCSQLILEKEERFSPHEICSIQRNLIHAIRNDREERLITVNVYAPVITDYTIYPLAEAHSM